MRLFGDLLHLDADGIELSRSKVNFTTAEIPDGGIDASVENDTALDKSGDLIIDQNCFYQVKAGISFTPWQEAKIRDELLHGKKPTKENLGKEVQRCFEKSGTYILVCMKADLTPERKSDAEQNLKKIFEECGISDPKVQVWGPEKIIGAIVRYPPLVSRISGHSDTVFKSHEEWAQQGHMQKTPLALDDDQNKSIQAIRSGLGNAEEAVHLDIHGETGVGKTRLVLEATRDPSLAPGVAYFTSPKHIIDSAFLRQIVRDDAIRIILVVDGCDHNSSTAIWDDL